MKNILSLALAALSISLAAQPRPMPHPLEQAFDDERSRTEIILPQVNGMTFYKADLHMHTIFSDGDVTPDMRVVEAWCDGLDAIAITDHLEYRRIEREMFKFMDKYIREDLRKEGAAVNTNIAKQDPDGRGILVDLNVAYNAAVAKAANYGILVVRGAEITRKSHGHYNVLFTRDNNAIYDPDIEQALRNARAQDAFIVHNHPVYEENTPNHLTPASIGLYEKGFIDGEEVANGKRTWWYLFTHAISSGYTPLANSDAHEYIYWKYGRPCDFEIPRYRNMNLILAKALTEKDLKAALKAGNTIAYSNNNLIGRKELLEALFSASVAFKIQGATPTKNNVTVVNRSSLPYCFRIGDKEYVLNALGSLFLTLPKDEKRITATVLNMWYGDEDHPAVSFTLK